MFLVHVICSTLVRLSIGKIACTKIAASKLYAFWMLISIARTPPQKVTWIYVHLYPHTLASPEYNQMLLIVSIIVKPISLFSFPFLSLWELGHHFACLLAIISSLRSVSSFALPIFLLCGCSSHWGYSSLWVKDVGPLFITYFDLVFYFFHM